MVVKVAEYPKDLFELQGLYQKEFPQYEWDFAYDVASHSAPEAHLLSEMAVLLETALGSLEKGRKTNHDYFAQSIASKLDGGRTRRSSTAGMTASGPARGRGGPQ